MISFDFFSADYTTSASLSKSLEEFTIRRVMKIFATRKASVNSLVF